MLKTTLHALLLLPLVDYFRDLVLLTLLVDVVAALVVFGRIARALEVVPGLAKVAAHHGGLPLLPRDVGLFEVGDECAAAGV